MNTLKSTYKNPDWWNSENDSAWDRVKLAIKRDWDQTKHDLGGNEPDTHQNISHTTRQATGNEAIPPRGTPNHDDVESAHRFGYGARLHYGKNYPDWNNDLELRLAEDWRKSNPSRQETWMQDRAAIRYGWDYEDDDDYAEGDEKE